MKITREEARQLMDEVAPHLNPDPDSFCNSMQGPYFPPGREDVCAVRWSTENGYSYGFDIIYLVWKNGEKISCRELADTRSTKDYQFIKEISLDGDIARVVTSKGEVSFKIG